MALLPNRAVRRFHWIRVASVAWKVAALLLLLVLIVKLTGGF